MDEYKIRLGHTDSVDSVDRENFLDVELENTSKQLHFTDVKKTIDQYEIFQNERDKSNKYRLIISINPFCSNVLFNPFTEIVKIESDYSDCERFIDNDVTCQGIDGDETPKRIQMINNTEYSKPEPANGYVYLPGYDIFDNHIKRNKSFKVVSKITNSQNAGVFNTLADTLRDNQGKVKKMYVRTNGLDTKPVSLDMHLYSYSDLLSFEDSVNTNLMEENGWFGFINSSNLVTNQSKGIERVLNNREACEFIDMYPNRELFSFNPSYNERFDRLEYNWDIALTYPYENEYDNQIVFGNGVNGLRILSATIEYGPSGEAVAIFRSYVKHNLKRNESIILWRSENQSSNGTVGEYKAIENYVRIKNVGDVDGNYKEHFFYVSADEIFSDYTLTTTDLVMTLMMALGTEYEGVSVGDIPKIFDITSEAGLQEGTMIDYLEVLSRGFESNKLKIMMNIFIDEFFSFRFQRVVNGAPSRYYVRKFKKIPNFKKKKREVIESDLIDRNSFNSYENGDGNAVYDFDKEFYKLGFATTIYGDDCSQITYTDTINVENLTDNLGRPLSEIYVTIVKRNKGNDIWYTSDNKREIFGKDVEQSHCFSEIISGFEISDIAHDQKAVRRTRANMGDILYLNKTETNDSLLKSSRPIEQNISIEQNFFEGDIVEFSPYEFKEYILSDINHRFNTYQREHPLRSLNGNNEKLPFIYHEIAGDDYDYPINNGGVDDVPFAIEQIMIGDNKNPLVSLQNRNEGYYYKPHYKIMLREFGDVQQDSHFELKISTVAPIHSKKIFIKIKTLLPHKLNNGDIILIVDDENNFTFKFNCVYIENKLTFYIIPCIPPGSDINEWEYFKNITETKYEEGLTWLSVTEYLRDGILCARKQNYLIPDYAIKSGKNTFLWRNLLSPNDSEIKEVPEYVFTNDCFYVHKTIDFFLKRQDPEGNNGLYAKDVFPNDVIGKIKKDSVYEYKEEIVPIC